MMDHLLKIIDREQGITAHCPITHLVEPTIFEGASGILGIVMQVSGMPFETETSEVLNFAKQRWQQALLGLDDRFLIYVYIHRTKINTLWEGNFNNEFAYMLNEAYTQQFRQSSLYTNQIYLVLCYKGIVSGKLGKSFHFFRRISETAIKTAREAIRQEHVKILKQTAYRLLVKLKPFNPRLLGEHSQDYSELLTFLGCLLNAGDSQRFIFPTMLTVYGHTLAEAIKNYQYYPQGHLCAHLAKRRLFFGKDIIQFEGNTEQERRFGAIVVIKHYGESTSSIMLDTLLHLDSEFILCHSFAIEDQEYVDKRMRQQMNKLASVDDPAASQFDDLKIARDDLASRRINMGYHQASLLLLASDALVLEERIHQAIRCFADAGIVAIREQIALQPAYFAMIPTNIKYQKRSALISNRNFVGFAPLHNYRTGYRDSNHLGNAVTLLQTPSRTPLFFNFHAKGSHQNPSKGHSAIFGANDSGKTVFLGFMDAQLDRYGGNHFIFDRNRGLEIYIRASGGSYFRLAPRQLGDTTFNPLQLPDTPFNRKFCRQWLQQLACDEDEVNLPTDIQAWLSQCVDYSFDKLEPPYRRLNRILQLLPANFPRWQQLKRWLHGQHGSPDGEYAYLFDNDKDSLLLSKHIGFDMTHFLDKEPGSVLTAVAMYLFHRIELSLDGQLTTIILDEFWQYLKNPYFANKLEVWLPTLRKLNTFFLLATQSPATVASSSIKHIILDNIATLIFFPNPQATTKIYQEGFNLTESEYHAIKNALPESRLFLIKQEQESCLARLNLEGLSDYLAILSANEKTVRLLDKIRAEVGDDPKIWWPIFHKQRKSKC